MADPLQFSDLYGSNGIGFYVQDTDTSSAADRKKAANDAYVELASIRGKWRLGSTTYTSATSPALTADTATYNLPDNFDSHFRTYYREVGRYVDIEVVSDSEWLIRSATRTSDSGDPKSARIKQTSSTQDAIEFSPAPSAGFVSRIGTITVEYWKEITRLVEDTDEPILPANLRHHIIPVGAYKYAIGQGDDSLINRLVTPQGRSRLSLLEEAYAAVMRHDLTRTGRARKIRPAYNYTIPTTTFSADYGEIQ